MKPVLILGASGKIGRALQRYWRANPSSSIAPLWAERGQEEVTGVQVQAIVALWGVTAGTDEDLSANAALATDAIALARKLSAARVLHLSSAAVYTPSDGALSEESDIAPTRPYGLAKTAMEQAIAGERKPPLSCALRLANVAGCDSLFKALSEGGDMTIDRFEAGNGPLRSYIAIPELAAVLEALVGCSDSALPEVLNVAAPLPVDMGAIAAAAGRKFEWCPPRDGAVERYVLDTTRLQALVELPENASDAAHLVESWQTYGGWA